MPQQEWSQIDDLTLAALRQLSALYPTVDSALSRIVELRSELARPRPTVHVISDIHGEFKKLKHVINNASGSVRPLVDKLFAESLDDSERKVLLSFLYYPRESFTHHIAPLSSEQQSRFIQKLLGWEFQLIRHLATQINVAGYRKVLPHPYGLIFEEIIRAQDDAQQHQLISILLSEFSGQQKQLELLRLVARVARNLFISELVVAGDMGDRGPRVDKVIDYLMRQPNVAVTWGNHDASWLAACLGDLACIATVLRISLRYRRLSQLEEGYGITMAPLERLARSIYSSDEASRFQCKGDGLRDAQLMARMQKAAAIIQFKLEGQTIRRNKHFNLEHRNLLHRIDLRRGTIVLEDKEYPLLDDAFPTIDWSDPYKLSDDEAACMERIQRSFLESQVLWEQMKFVVSKGSMYLRRDNALIFHACVPVDDEGDFSDLQVDGEARQGKSLFDALEKVVQRSLRSRDQKDLDMLWYLWSGPRSPWFGKDKMATFEGYFIEDKDTHKELKNPYFKLIHNRDFCVKVLAEFGISDPEGLIVNGHVPVKVEQGESPLKESGLAVTIDGAFSEAYGDRGFTLALDRDGIKLAQHHHFESVDEAITAGADIIPVISSIRTYPKARLVIESERAPEILSDIKLLELLIEAYRDNVVREGESRSR
ncbi:MAG: fructose-bisphosphatase class III [Deltaproteobacteria bacterium]|nr:fructose-bisphosphatase class III [Deltaproteobacteria bacterium]